MTPPADYRHLMAELGIDDDRAERALVDLLVSKDAQIELERAKVPDAVWRLEDQLMKERMK